MPLPIGEPSGITAAQPASSRRWASTGSSLVYGSTVKPSATSVRAASISAAGSGMSVRSSPITSSLTQSLPSASRASWAVVTASRAVKQPAVLGSTKQPASSRTWRIEPRALGSTRRIATVAIWAPEASTACAISSRLRKPPVPRTSRESKLRSPISSATSAPLHRVEDLHLLALAEGGAGPLAARHHLAVHRHGHAAPLALDAGLAHRGLDGCVERQLARLAVQENGGHPATSARSPASCPATTSAVSGARSTPLR